MTIFKVHVQSPSLLCPWDFPSKNTGVCCHFFLQGIFPTQGLSPCPLCLLHCRQILYSLSHQGWGYLKQFILNLKITKINFGEFPDFSLVRTPSFHCCAQVPSLVSELRTYKLCDMAQKQVNFLFVQFIRKFILFLINSKDL